MSKCAAVVRGGGGWALLGLTDALRLKFPDFILNKDHPIPAIYGGEFRQYGNHVCSKQDPLSHFKGLQMGILGFSQKETGARDCCHGNNTIGAILFLL